MRFSRKEIEDIALSVAVISLAVSFMFTRQSIFSTDFIFFVLVSFITVGLGFILHEMSHKYVAQKYGCWAEFRAWKTGLTIALISAFLFNFIFIAPGAVYISRSLYLTKREDAYISLAGSFANVVLALFFGFLPLLLPFESFFLAQISAVGARVNLWLALFNQLPIPPLDGSKVFFWNKLAWLGVFAFIYALEKYILPLFLF